MRTIKYILFTSLHVVAMWLGLVEKIDGWLNVGLAMTWFCIIVSWFMLSDASIKHIAQNRRGKVFWAFDTLLDMMISGALFYFGWFITGGFYVLHIMIVQTARSEAEKRFAK